LEHKAEVETKDNTGWRALHYAARYRLEVVMWLLLENGADAAAKE
jgi:hypothetical protein